MKLKIAHLYPDLLEVYSDRGNVTVLKRRAEWRGFDVEVKAISIGDTADLSEYDILFSGGGEDREQSIVADDLLRRRSAFEKAIAEGTVILTICGSYQLLGRYFETIGGKRIEGLGLVDFFTVGGTKRLVGNTIGNLQIEGLAGNTIVGYENHSGRTYLGEGVKPLAVMTNGFGNNGEDRFEGVAQGTVFGTYMHGPLLSKNPHFADFLLRLALYRHTEDPVLIPLDDTWEMRAHQQIIEKYSQTVRV
ncbi:glutamine amidotransferase [Collibacillus ludicampi]|uniref:Lipid II isoglutaminyl synthase (glutamine-hydrolyzing) subunit GatD n=1 Tax=Collibacillus ludicampi TaxID=2771369 RepID=A0AAV4LKW8_9BACL|nr:glutamine amidotransferase [Collibacillus ludicampi]GIM48340.1 glutamine amidotransferase [Collibacillus ludicampi]